MKKYELTDETKGIKVRTLYRIRALIDFGDVKAGDLGGWIEKEENLNQEGQCWVYDNACVYDNARISGNAKVCDNAKIFGKAYITDDVNVTDNAWVSNNVCVFGNVCVFDDAYVYDNAHICGNAKVFGKACVYGNSCVSGNACVSDSACVSGNAHISGNAKVCDNAKIFGKACVDGNAIICEKMYVSHSKIDTDLRTDIAASLRGQCNLLLIRNKVIAYKIVNRNLTSLHDKNFIYKVGEIAEVEDPDESNKSCASGLHFSNLTYWDNNIQGYKYKTYLIAEINVEDIITIQQGKIRCRKAKILDKIDIE